MIEDWSAKQRAGHRLVAVSRQARGSPSCGPTPAQDPTGRLGVAFAPGRVAGRVRRRQRALTLVQGTLDEGWTLLPAPGAPSLHLFTDAEIFGWSKPRPRRLRRKPAHPEVFFADLNPGDYVVHVDFGIGLFRGLIKATIDGAEREYLRVDYAGQDSVYVPIHHADRLSRYVGSIERPPACAPPGHGRLGARQGAGQKGGAGHRQGPAGPLFGAPGGARARLFARQRVADRVGGVLSLHRDRRPVARHRRGQGGHGKADARWIA